MVGLGLGGMWLRTTCTLHQELLLQPLLPRNQHPSPTTAFTNIKQNHVLLLARDVHALTPGALGTIVDVVGCARTILAPFHFISSF